MNKRLAGVLIFAFVVSLAASLILYRLISARLAAQAQPAKGQLVVAARDLPNGTLIKDLDVKLVDWSGTMPPQAVLKVEDAVGRGVIANIYNGEPLLETRLAAKGAGAGLAATIPTGKRAVAIPVNDVTAVAGFANVGARVDVLILGNPPNAPPTLGTQTKTLLQNMEVLSAGQEIRKDAEGKPISVPVVNLLVTPEEAEILSLATNAAGIRLVLRNPLDNEKATPPGTAMSKLWAGQQLAPPPRVDAQRKLVAAVRPPSPPPPVKAQLTEKQKAEEKKPPPPVVVEVIHGVNKVEAKFEEKKAEAR